MTEGMMGRSSDTRMYAPRSESSHMFRENHEDERTRTGTEDPRDSESKLDKRQAKKEKEEEEDRGIRHIKVRRHHLSAMHDDEEEEEGLDDSTKLDADREVGLQTNPMGTGGFLTSLATGAKGPGAAHGHMVATGEPMDLSWRLLKDIESEIFDEEGNLKGTGRYSNVEYRQEVEVGNRPHQHIPTSTLDNIFDRYGDIGDFLGTEDESWLNEYDKKFLQHYLGEDVSQHERILREMEMEHEGREKGLFDHVESPQGPHPFSPYYFAPKSEPMEHAWSDLLKQEDNSGLPPMNDNESMEEYMRRIGGPHEIFSQPLPPPMLPVRFRPTRPFDSQFQQKNASEPMFIGDVLVKAPPSKPKGLPAGVHHATHTGKTRAETERDIHADIQRRNRTHIPVMANLNEALLTSAQREQLPAMRKLIAEWGGVANIPPKRLHRGGVANFMPPSQTVAVEKPFRGYPGERKVDSRPSTQHLRENLRFANLRPSNIEDNLAAQYYPTVAHAVEVGDYMADLATFAHNTGSVPYDRTAESTAPLPEPTPEPTPEPQPVQEDKIEPGPYPGTYYVNGQFMDAHQFAAYQAQKNGEQKSEPMDRAWSELLKSKRMKEKKDKDEESKKFRPSTGAFDRPKGGFGGRPMTPARAKIISRNLPVGRHTGLNEAELSVEMSHRGIASKQPKSKDPQQYLDYMATQEAQKRLGNVRTPSGEHRRFGRPSLRNIPHPQKPRLHPVRAPRIQPPKGVRKPHLNKPKMPSIVTMSEDDVAHSDLMKSRSDVGQMRILVRELREALRDARDKDKKRKGMGTPDTSGAASNLPNHPSNSANQTSKPQGGTENEEAEAKMYGADPAQVINARGSNRS